MRNAYLALLIFFLNHVFSNGNYLSSRAVASENFFVKTENIDQENSYFKDGTILASNSKKSEEVYIDESILNSREDEYLDKNSIDSDIWGSILEKFRGGHHLSLGVGSVSGSWTLGKAGNLSNEKRATSGNSYEFRYFYQIKLANYLGYYVGSSMEVFVSNVGEESGFDEGSSYRMPSVNSGISYTPHWKYSVLAGIDYSIDRIDSLNYVDSAAGEEVKRTVGVTLEGGKLYLGGIYFYSAKSGVFVMSSFSNLKYTKPESINAGEGHPLDVNLSRTQKIISFGYIYHHF
jgi:hypothetical protein